MPLVFDSPVLKPLAAQLAPARAFFEAQPVYLLAALVAVGVTPLALLLSRGGKKTVGRWRPRRVGTRCVWELGARCGRSGRGGGQRWGWGTAGVHDCWLQLWSFPGAAPLCPCVLPCRQCAALSHFLLHASDARKTLA